MGRDKARLRLGDRTLLAHVRAIANATGSPVRIIRRDLVPRCGPLGGICTGLLTSIADAVLFLSCDMPFVTPRTLQSLAAKAGRPVRPVFLESAGVVGFPFLIPRSALLQIQRRAARRDWSLQGLARSLKSNRLRLPAGRARELFNINTPGDLMRARQFWRERPPRGPARLSRTALSDTHTAGRILPC